MRLVSMLSLGISALGLVACSSVPQVSNDYEYYGQDYAQKVVNSITEIDNRRYDAAWNEGPSKIEIAYANLHGENPYTDWQPTVDVPPSEQATLIKYNDVLKVYDLFKGTDVSIRANDAVTVISLPYSWVFRDVDTYDLSMPAKKLLKQLPDLFTTKDLSVYVKSFGVNINFGASDEWLSQKRSDVVSAYLVGHHEPDNHAFDAKNIRSLALQASDVRTLQPLKSVDVTQIYIRHLIPVNSQKVLDSVKEH